MVGEDFEDVADDAAAIMDAVGRDSASLFGHSGGGLDAQRIALRHPGRVRGLATAAAIATTATEPLLTGRFSSPTRADSA